MDNHNTSNEETFEEKIERIRNSIMPNASESSRRRRNKYSYMNSHINKESFEDKYKRILEGNLPILKDISELDIKCYYNHISEETGLLYLKDTHKIEKTIANNKRAFGEHVCRMQKMTDGTYRGSAYLIIYRVLVETLAIWYQRNTTRAYFMNSMPYVTDIKETLLTLEQEFELNNKIHSQKEQEIELNY